MTDKRPVPAGIAGPVPGSNGGFTMVVFTAAEVPDGTPVFVRSADTVAALQAHIDALESLRPHWAKGYTSDSIAAQTTITALNQIWSILGVDNQTAAMDRLRQLTSTGGHRT